MKQTYISPETIVVRTSLHNQLLAGSLGMTGNDATVDGSGNYVTLSRRNSVWDDEDE